MQEQLPGDAAVERTGMYSQGELRSKRGCPGVQRVPKVYDDPTAYALVSTRTERNVYQEPACDEVSESFKPY